MVGSGGRAIGGWRRAVDDANGRGGSMRVYDGVEDRRDGEEENERQREGAHSNLKGESVMQKRWNSAFSHAHNLS